MQQFQKHKFQGKGQDRLILCSENSTNISRPSFLKIKLKPSTNIVDKENNRSFQQNKKASKIMNQMSLKALPKKFLFSWRKIIIIFSMLKLKGQNDQSFHGAPSCKYSRISEHTKDKLCYVVKSTSIKVSSAAKILKINPSTAKLIIRKFNQMSYEDQLKVLERGKKSKKQKTSICNQFTKTELIDNKIGPTQIFQSSVEEDQDKNQANREQKSVATPPITPIQKTNLPSQSCSLNYVVVYYPFIQFLS